MKEILKEINLLYQKSLENFLVSQYGPKNEDLYLSFLRTHFIRANNIVLACNHLTSVGYADEANILSRTLLECIVDFIMIVADEDKDNIDKSNEAILQRRIERIKQLYKHQQMYPLYSCRNLFSDEYFSDNGEYKNIEQITKGYQSNFGTSQKWYKKTLTDAINLIEAGNQNKTLMVAYKQLCFYTHNNYMIFDKLNQKGKYSDAPLLEPILFYHTLYSTYLKCFSIILPDETYFVEEYDLISNKIQQKLETN